jgi:hypothetical protein
MEIVDLSGYSFTGKSYLYDLLEKSREVKGFGRDFEFDLLRINGGLIPLFMSLRPLDYSPIRASYAIEQFKKLSGKLVSKNIFHKIFVNPGVNYGSKFSHFNIATDKFITRLIDFQLDTYWPYSIVSDNAFDVLLAKIKNKFGHSVKSGVFFSRIDESTLLSIFREYIKDLFTGVLSGEEHVVILSNACEPYSPNLGMKILSCKNIIVDRDPRDIYLSAMIHREECGGNVADVVLGSSVEDFIQRYKLLRLNNSNEGSLVVRFEDLVSRDELTINRICEYTGIWDFKEVLMSSPAPFTGTQMWKSVKNATLLMDVNKIDEALGLVSYKND